MRTTPQKKETETLTMKWGILGPGTIANKFADTITQMSGEGQVLSAVGSRSFEKADAFAKKWNIPSAYGSYEEFLKDPEVEAVYIATPNCLHKEHTLMCLSAGKHVLCEKPFTINAEDARMLYQTAEEKGLFLMEGLWTRFLPLYHQIMDLIHSGTYGKLLHARADYGFASSGARRERKFTSDLGGGALLDIGIYTLGFLTMVMEEMPVSFTSSVRFSEYGTDCFSAIQLNFSEGRTAHAVQSIGTVMDRRAALFFEKAQIHLTDFQNAFAMTVDPEGEEIFDILCPPKINGFEYEIRDMSECVALKRTSSKIYTSKESIAMMELLEKIRRSWNMRFSFEEEF